MHDARGRADLGVAIGLDVLQGEVDEARLALQQPEQLQRGSLDASCGAGGGGATGATTGVTTGAGAVAATGAGAAGSGQPSSRRRCVGGKIGPRQDGEEAAKGQRQTGQQMGSRFAHVEFRCHDGRQLDQPARPGESRDVTQTWNERAAACAEQRRGGKIRFFPSIRENPENPLHNGGSDARWSSLVARWAHNPKVASSNLARATKHQDAR